ncbi:MAG: hypothetical protein IPJ13_01330 [Saprospiraceae bacterium]|nr:hypothetical protein [Saprospiraceae bacterium]
MKTLKLIILSFSIFIRSLLPNQSRDGITGLPGDHFSLEGALELFKKSSSPEDFEKQLNSKDNNVNNLDLNDDNDIDYVKVISKNGRWGTYIDTSSTHLSG